MNGWVIQSRYLVLLVILTSCILVFFCSSARCDAISPLGKQQQRASTSKLHGAWVTELAGQRVELSLAADQSTSRYRIGQTDHDLLVSGDQLVIVAPSGEIRYDYEIVGNQLTLSGGDLSTPIVFVRRFDLLAYLSTGWSLTAEALWEKGYRIAFIVAVVVAARLIIAVMRALSYAMIFWNVGPFALIYRHNKNRARTVHSLALNFLKYFVYFTSLGMVLSELGINYATYLASLSVVGLAIGFGSQGLVQDMVTGFFIIFEGQFDVGDMVEISGQTGYVTNIGLRMTKIRSYLGQEVVIPNRNIAVVGNYRHGGQKAHVDIPVNSEEHAQEVAATTTRIAEQLTRQYPEVAMGSIHTSDITLETSERFSRLHLSIWPGQTWVVDQHLIPRIKRVLGEQGSELSSDPITVYYHPKQPSPRQRWQAGRSWFMKWQPADPG